MEWKKNWLWSPINDEVEATKLLILFSKGWYVLGAMHMAFGALMLYAGAPLSGFTDGVAYVVAGYFLKERKSRTLAMIAVLSSLVIATLTFGSFFGIYEGTGGRNIVLAILAVCVAWRTDQATHAYHDSIGSKVEWKNVAVVWAIVVVLSVVAVLLVTGTVMLLGIVELPIDTTRPTQITRAEGTVGRVMMLTLMGLWVASFTLLSKRFPFTVVDTATRDADSDGDYETKVEPSTRDPI